MAHKVKNLTIYQITMHLRGTNAVTLMPRNACDINGPTDECLLVNDEHLCEDVVRRRRAGDISIEEVADKSKAAPKAVAEQARKVSDSRED